MYWIPALLNVIVIAMLVLTDYLLARRIHVLQVDAFITNTEIADLQGETLYADEVITRLLARVTVLEADKVTLKVPRRAVKKPTTAE